MRSPSSRKGMADPTNVKAFCCFCGACFHPYAPSLDEAEALDLAASEAKGNKSAWLTDIIMLGWNQHAPSREKSFVTGQSVPDGDGTFLSERSDDPLWPSPAEYDRRSSKTGRVRQIKVFAFKSGEFKGYSYIPFYPFHVSCFNVFRAYVSNQSERMVDKGVLYGTFDSLCGKDRLTIDYGEIETCQQQRFKLSAGQEQFIYDPSDTSELADLYSSLPTMRSQQGRTRVKHTVRNSSSNKVRPAVLSLPVELLESVLLHLPIASIHNFQQTCTQASRFRPSSQFWKRKVAIDMPYLYEFHAVSWTSQAHWIDWPAAYRRLHEAARPHSQHTIRSLANRRRVWGLCGKIFEYYRKRLITTKSISYPVLDAIAS